MQARLFPVGIIGVLYPIARIRQSVIVAATMPRARLLPSNALQKCCPPCQVGVDASSREAVVLVWALDQQVHSTVVLVQLY